MRYRYIIHHTQAKQGYDNINKHIIRSVIIIDIQENQSIQSCQDLEYNSQTYNIDSHYIKTLNVLSTLKHTKA